VRGKGDDVLGFIKLLAVEKNSRRRGIGTKLLQELEQRLARLRVTTIRVFDSAPNYLIPGIDPRDTETLVFFEHHGYQRFSETANMEVDLHARNFNTDDEETRLRAQGFEIRRAIMGDKDDLIAFLQQHWAAWIPEAERALLNYPISLHLALSHDRVVAFAAYDGNNVNTGWFGPMGTDPSRRGAGLGAVLLKRCLVDLQAQNHRLAIIPWVGPYRFYLCHAGATISRVFWRYRKNL
jgi:GNAT superfamily N-acetyltransferase